jgi:hypothetical protein
VFINAINGDEAIWFLLGGLYTIVSGSTVHTVIIGRKTNGIRRCFTEVVLKVMGGKIRNWRRQDESNILLVIRGYWLETLIE